MTGPWEKYQKKPWEVYQSFVAPEPPEGVTIHGEGRGVASPEEEHAHILEQEGAKRAKGFGPITRMLMPIGQGVSIGSIDEVAAGLSAIPNALRSGNSIADEYRIGHSAMGQSLARERRENPGRSMLGEIAGVVATLPAAPALTPLKGPGMLPRVGNAAATGGAYGGAYGFNAGDGLRDRLTGAGQGAALGGALGVAIPPIASALRGAGRVIASPFRRADRFASRKVAEAASQAGMTADDLTAALQRQQAGAGGEGMLVEAMGKPGQRLARAVINKDSPAATGLVDKVMDRQRGQAPRLIQGLGRELGDPATFYGSLDDISARMKTAATPFYDMAYSRPVPFTREIEAIQKRVPGTAAKHANKIMAADGVTSPQLFIKVSDDGAISAKQVPNMQQWDYIKRGLDQMIEGQTKEGKVSTYGRSLVNLKNELLARLDDAVPEYAEARRIYAGDAAMKDALKLGRKALSTDHEATTRVLAKMSEGEQQMFRIGVSRELQRRIDVKRDTADVVNAIWNSKNRQILETVFPDKAAFERFAANVKAEQAVSQTTQAARGNSTTAQQLSDMVTAGVDPATVGGQLVRGDVLGAVGTAAGRAASTAGGLTQKRADEIARLLSGTSVPPRVLRQLQRVHRGGKGDLLTAGLLSRGAQPVPEIMAPYRRRSY